MKDVFKKKQQEEKEENQNLEITKKIMDYSHQHDLLDYREEFATQSGRKVVYEHKGKITKSLEVASKTVSEYAQKGADFVKKLLGK